MLEGQSLNIGFPCCSAISSFINWIQPSLLMGPVGVLRYFSPCLHSAGVLATNLLARLTFEKGDDS